VQIALGENIRIHCVKIGDANIKPDPKVIMNTIHSSESDDAKVIRDIQNKVKDLEGAVRATQTESRKSAINSEISYLQKQLHERLQRYAQRAMSNYGNEIIELSSIFVNVADIDPKRLFTLPPERIDEFVVLSKDILTLLKENPSAEDAKLAAVLYDHLETVLRFNDVHIETLTEQKNELGNILTNLVQQQSAKELQLQLSRILRSGLKKAARIPLARLFVIFYRIIKQRVLTLIKQRRVSRIKKLRKKARHR